VHLGCLRRWLERQSAQGRTAQCLRLNLACELCKADFPACIRVAAHEEPLVQIPWAKPPFMVLESTKVQGHTHRELFVLSFAAQSILRLGRGPESEVKVDGRSVSHLHAILRFDQGNFRIEDCNSTFGTFVEVNRPHMLQAGKTLCVQGGCNSFSITLQPQVNSANNATPQPQTTMLDPVYGFFNSCSAKRPQEKDKDEGKREQKVRGARGCSRGGLNGIQPAQPLGDLPCQPGSRDKFPESALGTRNLISPKLRAC